MRSVETNRRHTGSRIKNSTMGSPGPLLDYLATMTSTPRRNWPRWVWTPPAWEHGCGPWPRPRIPDRASALGAPRPGLGTMGGEGLLTVAWGLRSGTGREEDFSKKIETGTQGAACPWGRGWNSLPSPCRPGALAPTAERPGPIPGPARNASRSRPSRGLFPVETAPPPLSWHARASPRW